ncbi:MAG: hypothetical protein ACOYW7_08765 [Nitrospirota bacterium]
MMMIGETKRMHNASPRAGYSQQNAATEHRQHAPASLPFALERARITIRQ